MKESLAAAPAAIWNRKNLPTDHERFSHRPGRIAEMAGTMMPAALAGFARRQSRMMMLSLALAATLGLTWFFAQGDFGRQPNHS